MLKNTRVKDRIHYNSIKFKSNRGFNWVMMFLADDVPGKAGIDSKPKLKVLSK